MYNPLNINAPYDSLKFIDNLSAYDTCVGNIGMLDLIKELQESDNYYFQGLSFPNGADTQVNGGSTVNGTFQVVPGTYVTSIQFYNDFLGECTGNGAVANTWGFKFKLYDKGTKASIFYGDYALERVVASDMQQQIGVGTHPLPSDPGSNADSPFGPNYLLNPFIVTNPGVIGWELVSNGVVGTSSQMQVLVCVAVPVNAASISHRVVQKG